MLAPSVRERYRADWRLLEVRDGRVRGRDSNGQSFDLALSDLREVCLERPGAGAGSAFLVTAASILVPAAILAFSLLTAHIPQ